MAIPKPYRRICRPFLDGTYSGISYFGYVSHPSYSSSPEHYVRAALLLIQDLQKLFDFIEPDEGNSGAFSFRTHELLVRTCIEIEANFKAIFDDNIPPKEKYLTMSHYKRINVSHHLSSYGVKLPFWRGERQIRAPFKEWDSLDELAWYKAYNNAKHNRFNSFREATLDNVIDAICGLVTILSAQFYTYDFSPHDPLMAFEGLGDGMEEAIGGYFRVKFPNDWQEAERYDFKWADLRNTENPFCRFDYSQ